MLFGVPRSELLSEALAAPRSGLVLMPDTQVILRPGWFQIITPSFTRGGMNEVSCQLLPEGAEGEARIDETIAAYRRLGLRFRWTVCPGDSPPDLGEKLARRGLTRTESFVLARPTSDVPEAEQSAITVIEADLAHIDEYSRVTAQGWAMPEGPFAELNRRALEESGRYHFFLARKGGVPVAGAACLMLDRSAYLLSGVVLPEHRGQGLYRALVHARLRSAAARGLPYATTRAMAETSAPILWRLGFETVCAVETYTDG